MNNNEPKRFIQKLPAVMDLTGYSKSTIYRLMAENKFPKQRKLSEGGRACGWFSDDLQYWIDTRPQVNEV